MKKIVKPRRLPPGYHAWITDSDEISPPDSRKVVFRLLSDDGCTVLSGSVLTMGQHDALEVVDYFLREEMGEDFIHADRISITNAAWIHYRQNVNWWHRYVVHYIATWGVGAAFFIGVIQILTSI